ncbi:fha domain protein [Nannochloropsis gaditana]|uniref:Fha domain protein n=1 Tax=Nannochloropsis gaditana TaxID=72520 RepID=W7TSU5_9STRA|nr:fha domain protein [Nannochloropsis gaditana]
MGQVPSASAVVNVGQPNRTEEEWPQTFDENKTHVFSDAGVSGISRMLHPGATRLSLGNSGVAGTGSNWWVDAMVSTPLFPHGRSPASVGERQARHQKRVSKFRVFADGVVFEGPEAMAIGDTHDLSKGYECVMGRPVTRVTVGDKRAQQVLVAFADNKFWAVPSRQGFSRHLGVSLVLGDKTARGPKHTLRVGDILRLGSVGLLVSEMRTEADGGKSRTVSQEVLEQIREDVQTAPRQVLAPLRKDFFMGNSVHEEERTEEVGRRVVMVEEEEEDEEEEGGVDNDTGTEHSVSSSGSAGHQSRSLKGGLAGPEADSGEGGNGRYQCYICMDSEEEDGDVLIAPCQCKGSTALVHVKCLQRLLSTGDAAKRTSVTSTKHQNYTCKICKARYKTHVCLPDGSLLPLLNPTLMPPYLTLVVITRHESHPDLFNTIFQLSFARAAELSMGRSQGCDVVIGYRTVSTRHATISYSKGEFYYQDARSSNGSLLYLRGPLEIPTSRSIRLRMGRSVLSLRGRHALQLSSLPRRAAADAWRWLSATMGGSGNGGGAGEGEGQGVEGRRGRRNGAEEGTERRGNEARDLEGRLGLELLRDLHMGRFQAARARDSSLLSEEREAGLGEAERVVWRWGSSAGMGDGSEGTIGSRSGTSSMNRMVDSRSGGGGGGGSLLRSSLQQVDPPLEDQRQSPAVGGPEGLWRDSTEDFMNPGHTLTRERGEEIESPAARPAGGGARESTIPQRAAAIGAESGQDLELSFSLPPCQPRLRQTDLISAPSRRVVLERTHSSRVES